MGVRYKRDFHWLIDVASTQSGRKMELGFPAGQHLSSCLSHSVFLSIRLGWKLYHQTLSIIIRSQSRLVFPLVLLFLCLIWKLFLSFPFICFSFSLIFFFLPGIELLPAFQWCWTWPLILQHYVQIMIPKKNSVSLDGSRERLFFLNIWSLSKHPNLLRIMAWIEDVLSFLPFSYQKSAYSIIRNRSPTLSSVYLLTFTFTDGQLTPVNGNILIWLLVQNISHFSNVSNLDCLSRKW